MQKRIISFLLALSMLCLLAVPVLAHERPDHDDIEYVLFGDMDYKETHPNYSAKIQAIEDATYLCVDQYNGKGEKELANLQKEKIPDIPKTIDEFDFSGNNAHRNFTHRGWNVNYDSKAHWDVRQKILRNTVDKELFASSKSVFSWLPWSLVSSNYKAQCESFCELLYYIHIIGDHIEADKFTALVYVDSLTELNDRDNPGVIPDLITCCDTLFKSQNNTYTYKEFRQELEDLRDKSDKLTSSKGGVNTDEKFAEYHKCATDLLDLLSNYIPKLLKNEEFFTKSFS